MMLFTLRGLSVGANYKNLSEDCELKKVVQPEENKNSVIFTIAKS